ncbi:MAG: hypothetical protein Q7R96_06555 [Nanoarchaeota archaeon]|nr:hypothetical protein [Nanoarchaeota archaeon]
MGGCYDDYSSYRRPAVVQPVVKKVRKPANPKWKQRIATYAQSRDLEDLLAAGKEFFRTKRKGFIPKLAEVCGVKKVSDIPKEFTAWEYEIKINIEPNGKGKEPEVVAYLDAFDFPIGSNCRFIKDPVHNFAIGNNHFIGDDSDERMVVIEKAGKTYIKEKGLVVPVRLGVPYEEIIIKRTEVREENPISGVLEGIASATREEGVKYRGKLRKEKGDDFILDTNDGRIYSFTITRAHRTRVGEHTESGIQRQLELEYAGYLPGFKGFKINSEEQVIRGMIDLAKYTYTMYKGAPIINGWRMDLKVTAERKYDFLLGADKTRLLENHDRKLSLQDMTLDIVRRN